jgi:hypothetical protein
MEGCYVAGADPELMVCSPDGELVSAIPLIPGTKQKPTRVKCGAVQHDNVLAEFNVNPSGTSEEFEHNVREVLRELTKFVAPNRLLVRASADYPKTALDSEEALAFGCDPDFDGWTLMMNEFDGTKALESFRSAGGHFHVGYKGPTEEMLSDPYGKVEVVKMLDIFQGLPSVLLDPDPTAPKRRTLYGRAGAHRPKEYGVEYRALGNFWVRSPALLHLMYELAHTAVELTLQGESGKIITSIGERKVQKLINSSDRGGAGLVVDSVLQRYLPIQLRSLISGLAGHDADLYTAWAL